METAGGSKRALEDITLARDLNHVEARLARLPPHILRSCISERKPRIPVPSVPLSGPHAISDAKDRR